MLILIGLELGPVIFIFLILSYMMEKKSLNGRNDLRLAYLWDFITLIHHLSLLFLILTLVRSLLSSTLFMMNYSPLSSTLVLIIWMHYMIDDILLVVIIIMNLILIILENILIILQYLNCGLMMTKLKSRENRNDYVLDIYMVENITPYFIMI